MLYSVQICGNSCRQGGKEQRLAIICHMGWEERKKTVQTAERRWCLKKEPGGIQQTPQIFPQMLGPSPFYISSLVLFDGPPHPSQFLIWVHLFPKYTPLSLQSGMITTAHHLNPNLTSQCPTAHRIQSLLPKITSCLPGPSDPRPHRGNLTCSLWGRWRNSEE